jgi:hypothetical protein
MNTQQTNTQQPQELDPEVEGTKAYILSLCSAIGGLEEIEQSDGTVEQVYCVGDEALGSYSIKKKAVITILTAPHYYSLFKRFKKSHSCG